jgi:glycosyltransferase involved in cell wall biosynthesis
VIRGPMRPEHVATALRDVDALVVPSLWSENTPFVVLEGRAAGVPIVASAVDGIAEIVADGENGRLFAPGDVDGLARVMQRLVDDREELDRLSGRFGGVRTLLKNAREFAAMYDELVAARTAARMGVNS